MAEVPILHQKTAMHTLTGSTIIKKKTEENAQLLGRALPPCHPVCVASSALVATKLHVLV